MIKYEFRKLDERTIDELINLSYLWKEENCSYGIVPNEKDDLKEPLFVSLDNNRIIGYIFGHYYINEHKTSYINVGSKCFMIDELYILPSYRNKGIGKELFKLMEDYVKDECVYLTLSTSTKDYKKILHFYVDELDMKFHDAFLIKSMK